MATTAQNLIEETRRHLLSGQREERNTLGAGVTAGAASPLTMTFTYPIINTGLQAGAVLSVGLEDFYVWSAATGNLTASVQRAENGTTAAAHTTGDLVRVNTKFSDAAILSALNEEMVDLSSPMNGLYQVKTLDVTYNAAISGYDLTGVASSFLGVIEIRAKTPTVAANWPLIRRYDVARSMAVSEFASGSALLVFDEGYPGLAMHVRYKAPFTAFAAATEDAQTDAGLAATMNDIVPVGAAIRLMAGREIKRNFTDTQGDPRRAEEVPPGAVLGSLRGLQLLHAQRVAAEAARLDAQYPLRLSTH